MKKVFVSMVIGIMLIVSAMGTVWAADSEILVYLDGAKVEFDVKPQTINDRTMVPIRAIFEKMGAVVSWDDATQTAICTRGVITVKMTVNSTVMYVNNEAAVMDVSPVVIDGRTLAPARYVAEAFGANVQWDEANNTVIITSEEQQTLYAPDGRTITVFKSEVPAYLNVGWYKTYYEAQAANTPSSGNSSQITNNNVASGVYRTPSGKKYHFDPDCGGKNSYETTLQQAKSAGLTPCAKCAY